MGQLTAEEIRMRAIRIARLHAQSSTPEGDRAAAELALRGEGLSDHEAQTFWDAYVDEGRALKAAAQMSDEDWRDVGRKAARSLLADEDRALTVRDICAPTPATAEKIWQALLLNDAFTRLPRTRRTEAEALAVDAAFGVLKEQRERAPRRALLAQLIGESGDRGESHRAQLVQAAAGAGEAVAPLLLSATATSAVVKVKAGAVPPEAQFFLLRCQLTYKTQLRRGSAERRAVRLAERALCSMLRAADGGDLREHVPDAWRDAEEALRAAFDGPGLAARLERLHSAVLDALPDSYLEALGMPRPFDAPERRCA